MATTIKLKNSVTTSAAPTTLVQGEVAANITDKKLWVGNAASSPVQILGAGATVSGTNVDYTGTLTGGTGVVNLGSGQFYKDASGNIGVGTASPVAKLDIVGSAGAANRSLKIKPSSNGADIPNLRTVFIENASNDGALALGFSTATDAWVMATTYGSTGAYKPLVFATSDVERMRIDANGNVGIGTSSPTASLTVANGNIDGFDNITLSAIAIGTNGTVATIASNGTGGVIKFNTVSTERMRIDSSGNLLVNRTSSQFLGGAAKFGITQADSGAWAMGVNANGNAIVFNHTANASAAVGSITVTTSLTLYNTTSDYRLKTVIAPIFNSGTRIDALQPIEYDFKTGGRTRGFLAHQFAEVYPNSVTGEKDAVDAEGKPVYQGMQASSPEVMADLIAEIQSLRKRVAQLESK